MPEELGDTYGGKTRSPEANEMLTIVNSIEGVAIDATTNPKKVFPGIRTENKSLAGDFKNLNEKEQKQFETYVYDQVKKQTGLNITEDITIGRNIILTGKIMASDGITVLLDGNSLAPSPSPFASTDKTHYHSSKRFKQNIHPLERMIENVYQLKPVSYDYKEAFKQYKTPNAANSEIGLIAEQVLSLIPEITLVDDDKVMGIDYPKLSILLLKAVQELKAEVTGLQQSNLQLQKQMDNLSKAGTVEDISAMSSVK